LVGFPDHKSETRQGGTELLAPLFKGDSDLRSSQIKLFKHPLSAGVKYLTIEYVSPTTFDRIYTSSEFNRIRWKVDLKNVQSRLFEKIECATLIGKSIFFVRGKNVFELLSYKKFRDTPSVRFFDITVPESNVRDLVVHQGPAISPPDSDEGYWQFYLHSHQEDNLLAISGGRTFYLVNFTWNYPYHLVRLESDREILRIPRGTFHRSVSDRNGSIIMNQAVRDVEATVASEFRVYNSGQIPRLLQVTSASAPLPKLHGFQW
jgi:hypothetical protein